MIISTQDTRSHAEPQPKRKNRVRRTRRQWKALLEQFHSSGLTKAAFCKQHGIATSSLIRWQRILEASPGVADFIDVTEPLSLAPAAPPAREPDGTAWQVELALGNDIVLRVRGA